jgi:hypothetical protein
MDPKYADMSVAEAVRRSMAIPFFFEPRREDGHEIIDGGTMDNYPIGLFLVKKHKFFSNIVEDGPDPDVHMKRVKFGFSPGTMGMGPGSSIASLMAQILSVLGPNLNVAMPTLPPTELAFLERVFSVLETNLNDSPLFTAMLDDLKDFYKVHQVAIKGDFGPFSTYNFDITAPRFRMMCSAGWVATIEKLDDAAFMQHFPRFTVRERSDPY